MSHFGEIGRGVRARVRRLMRLPLHTNRSVQDDADAELESFLQERTQALVARGLSADEARAEALRRLGGSVEETRRTLRRSAARRERRLRLGEIIGDAAAGLRYVARSLARKPGFTIATIGTVALAVGAACTVFAVVDPILLRPLPYPEADRLVGLWHTMPGLGIEVAKQSPGTYTLYRENAKSLAAIGVYVSLASTLSFGHSRAEPERARVTRMTPSTFTVLGARPLLGRLFTDADAAAGAPDVILVSEALWRTRFGADPRVVGRTLDVDGAPHTIIGVMPAAFAFPLPSTPAWVPLDLAHPAYAGSFGWDGIGRLRPGVTIAEASRELQALLPRLPRRFPEQQPGVSTETVLRQTRLAAVVHSMRSDVIGGVDHVLWLITAIVVLLVIVALSNVASLLLVRVEARRRELALRAALGASARAVWASATGEALVASVIGGAIGIALAAAAVRWVAHAAPLDLPRLNEVRVDGAVVGAAAALTFAFAAVGLIVGASRLRSGEAATVLRSAGRATAASGAQRFRSIFVGLEVALALVLLASSAVMVRSAERLRAVRPGFDPSHVFTFWTFLPQSRYRSSSDVARFYRELLDRVQRLPGVESDAATGKLPLEVEGFPYRVLVWADDGSTPSAIPPAFQATSVTSTYFQTMRIPLVAGHTFDEANARRGAREAVVSRGFAEHFWLDRTGRIGLGKRVRLSANGPWFTVVGVAADVRDSSLTLPPISEVYFDQEPVPDSTGRGPNTTGRDMAIVVRTHGDVKGLATRLRRELHALDPDLPFYRPATMQQIVSDNDAQLTTALSVLSAGAVATLVLGIVGLYGVIAYVVGLRSREISIRIALGLAPARAAALVLRQGRGIVLAGAAGGTLVSVGFGRLLRSLVFGVSPTDLPTLLCAITGVVAIALVAMSLPARRAARLNLVDALKAED